MGTETDIKSSNPSELQPLEEFDPNQEPVGERDETDDTYDQEQAKESNTPEDTVANEPEIPIDGDDGQVESDAQEATNDAGDDLEIHQDKTGDEVDEPDSDEPETSLAAASEDSDSDGGAGSEDETEDSSSDGDDNSSDTEKPPAGAPPEEPVENDDGGAVEADETTDSDSAGDGNSTDK